MRTFKMAAIAAIASLSIGAAANAQTGTTTGRKGGTQNEPVQTQTQGQAKVDIQHSQGMASVKTEVQVIRQNLENGTITKEQAKEQLKAIHHRLKDQRKARVADIKAAVEAGRMTKDQAKAELRAEREQMKELKKGLKVKGKANLELRKEKKAKKNK